MLLQDDRIEPNHVGLCGRGSLHGAALHGHLNVVECLLADPRIDVNIIDEEGRSPLFDAARKGRTNIVSTLLRDGRLDSASITRAAEVATSPSVLELLSRACAHNCI